MMAAWAAFCEQKPLDRCGEGCSFARDETVG